MIDIKNIIRDKKEQSVFETETFPQTKSASQTTTHFESIHMKTTILVLILQTFIFIIEIMGPIDPFSMNEKALKKKLKKIEKKNVNGRRWFNVFYKRDKIKPSILC